jgi:hypothetical protein
MAATMMEFAGKFESHMHVSLIAHLRADIPRLPASAN